MPFMHQRPIKVIDLDEVRSVSGDEGDVAEKPVKLVKLASQQHPNDDTGQDDCGEQGGGDQSIGGDQVAEVDPVDQGDQQDRQDQGVQQEEPVVDGTPTTAQTIPMAIQRVRRTVTMEPRPMNQ